MSDSAVSLYFRLKDGEKADLELIAQAAINWVEALRAAALVIDPEAEIRIEFVDAQEGSLRINTLLQWAENQLSRIQEGAGNYPRLRKLALALVVFIPVSAIPTWDHYFNAPPKLELNDRDRERIDELLRRMREDPEVEQKRKQFFRNIESKAPILEVGIAEQASDAPIITVPSKEFAERAGLFEPQEAQDERFTTREVDVILVSPVLISKPRAWKFYEEGVGEFTATMRDAEFLSALEHNHIQERLRTRIHMRILLRREERKEMGVWELKHAGLSVDKVLEPSIG